MLGSIKLGSSTFNVLKSTKKLSDSLRNLQQQRPLANHGSLRAVPLTASPTPASETASTPASDPTTPVPATVTPTTSTAWPEDHHHWHFGFKHHLREGGRDQNVTFKLEANAWLKTVTDHHGRQRIQTFTDPDGDSTFSPAPRDPLTGQSNASSSGSSVAKATSPCAHPGQQSTLTFDGTTLTETKLRHFGSLVTTYTDPDQDGSFTPAGQVFQPSTPKTTTSLASVLGGAGFFW